MSVKGTKLQALKELLCDELGFKYVPGGSSNSYRFNFKELDLDLRVIVPKSGGAWHVNDYSKSFIGDNFNSRLMWEKLCESEAISKIKSRLNSRVEAYDRFYSMPGPVQSVVSDLLEKVDDLEIRVKELEYWRNS